jgi:hypothetical protein
MVADPAMVGSAWAGHAATRLITSAPIIAPNVVLAFDTVGSSL